MWRYATFIVALISVGASTLAIAQTGGSFDLSWSALHSGEQSSGGVFTLNSSIGQTIAGESSGGAFALNSGFQQCHTETPAVPAIAHNSSDVAISWVGNTANVYRSENDPYFDPTTAAGNAVPPPWKDLGAVTSGQNYTYLIRNLNSCGESANSTRIGIFHFGLTPGS